MAPTDREDRWEQTASKWERFVTWFTPFRLVLVIIVLIAVSVAGTFGYRWFIAEPEGALEAREQTVGSGDFRIAAYDHFFDLCTSVQRLEAQADALQAELNGNPPPTPARVSQIQASLTAVTAQRNGAISEYNNDANRDYTVGQFRDSDLPYQLDSNEEDTACSV